FTDPAYYAREADYADLARVLVATGRSGEALPLIEQLVEAAFSMGRQGDAIRYLALQALALHEQGDTRSALASLEQALALAEPEGYIRVFIDEGEPMAGLLTRILEAQRKGRGVTSSRVSPDYIGTLLAAFDPGTKDQGPIRETETRPSSTILCRTAGSIPVEPMSERELEVLRLMAAGLKHREIADELFISLNTVRHHARNIYGKLGVNSRAQAIAKATDLRLL
ncbi:LuxR C-terminal-related transcriptional regulator, partial [Chloroflexota bacterium]